MLNLRADALTTAKTLCTTHDRMGGDPHLWTSPASILLDETGSLWLVITLDTFNALDRYQDV
jgi:hypothetical protein